MSNTEFVFLFNEQEAKRHASLEGIVADVRASRNVWPSNVTVHVENKNFTDLANEILQQVGTRGLAPTFAFLDPFGYRDVPMGLISKLLASPKSELFIYFDFNSATRFSTAGNVDGHFEALFGTDEFKKAPAAGDPNRQQFLHDLYQRQLSKLCDFPYVQSFEIVNSTGKTGHYLFFCTRSMLGLDRMKSVMWKLAPLGNYRFTDILAGQDVLFMEDVNVEPLKAALTQHFAGSTILIRAIEEYVMTRTPYVKSHIRTRTLKPMQAAGTISSPNQKQIGRFPDGTLVKFP
jgi:three-Cys-motif partner protein